MRSLCFHPSATSAGSAGRRCQDGPDRRSPGLRRRPLPTRSRHRTAHQQRHVPAPRRLHQQVHHLRPPATAPDGRHRLRRRHHCPRQRRPPMLRRRTPHIPASRQPRRRHPRQPPRDTVTGHDNDNTTGYSPQSATRQANDHEPLVPMTAFSSEKASGQTSDDLPGDDASQLGGDRHLRAEPLSQRGHLDLSGPPGSWSLPHQEPPAPARLSSRASQINTAISAGTEYAGAPPSDSRRSHTPYTRCQAPNEGRRCHQ